MIYDKAPQQATRFERVTISSDPLGRLTTYTYNPVNLRLTRQDARGYTTNYSYDALNRPSGRAYPDGSRVTFTYDAASQLLEMQDTSGNSINTYDLDGRPASFTAPVSGIQLTYSYDPVGNRVGMTEVGSGLSPQTYAYDPVGNLTRIVDPFGQVTTFTYDRLERELQHLSATPEILTTHAYDPAGRETFRTTVTVPDEGPPVASYDATYDNIGNRLTVDTYPEYDWQYTYDPANQLKTELVPAAGDYSVRPSRLEALPPPAPLRTVQDTFASHGSSISNAPLCFTGRGGLAQYWQG